MAAISSNDRGREAEGRAYYNEIDPFAADWIRSLIARGLIAPGDVDTRSIIDVRPNDLRGYTQCHFFAGIGGWSYALRQAGWDDARPVWTGSCPCQPFSLAGKQKGFDDERHLWPVWRELIRECTPAVVFGEQVASATEWLGLVRGDLEAMGHAVGAMPIQAASAGADHLRDRYWFVAYAESGEQWRVRESSEGSGWGQLQAGGYSGDAPCLADAPGERLPWPAAWADDARVAIAERNGASDVGHANCDRTFSRNEATASPRYGHSSGATGGSDGRNVGNAGGTGTGRDSRGASGTRAESAGERRITGDLGDQPVVSGSGLEWVIGADGKARRVKPGIRLLAHGVPNRVGTLRGFGNAIDYRPAKEFIGAFIDTIRAPALSSKERSHG